MLLDNVGVAGLSGLSTEACRAHVQLQNVAKLCNIYKNIKLFKSCVEDERCNNLV